MNSVPYLSHLDFVKGIRELTELCDYVCLDLSSNTASAGIKQFYKNPNALEKLLKSANKSRMEELGKAAALEFELASKLPIDYSNSVQRLYRRNCVVSTLRPMLLMVQMDLSVLKSDQRLPFLKIFSAFAKQNQIDGIVLHQDTFSNVEEQEVKYLRENTDLIVISKGQKLKEAQPIVDRIKSGAHLVQIYEPIFLKGPYGAYDLSK